MIMQVLSQKL